MNEDILWALLYKISEVLATAATAANAGEMTRVASSVGRAWRLIPENRRVFSDYLVSWTNVNGMLINTNKTKEMVIYFGKQ